MSVEAIAWALQQRTGRASAKSVLFMMANCADAENFVCWPSIAYLTETTELERKTVLDAVRLLSEKSLIRDTGERRGATRQIPVYQLNRSESGTVKEFRNRDGSADVTVPVLPNKSPVFAEEQSQFCLETVPKTGHGNVRKRNKETSGKRHRSGTAFSINAFQIPDWIPAEAWKGYCEMRSAKRKPINTQGIAQRIVSKLDAFRAAGHAVGQILDKSTIEEWTDIYEPREAQGAGARTRPGVHIGQQDHSGTWE